MKIVSLVAAASIVVIADGTTVAITFKMEYYLKKGTKKRRMQGLEDSYDEMKSYLEEVLKKAKKK